MTFELRRVHRYHVPDGGSRRCLMQPLGAAVEHDFSRLHFSAAPHRQCLGVLRKGHRCQPWCQLHVGHAPGIFLATQDLQMVQLGPGKAGFELAVGHDDGFDLRLAQTRFVLIGLEERARAAARHLSSCKIERAQMRLAAKRKAPVGAELCRFCGFRGQR